MSAHNQRGSHLSWHGHSSGSCSEGGRRFRHDAAPAYCEETLSFLAPRFYRNKMKLFRIDRDDGRKAGDHIGAIGDFWNYLKEDRPHKWTSLGLAIAIVGVVFYQIYASLIPPPPPRTIIYVESWPLSRSQAEVEADWKKRAIQANEDNAKRRAAYRSVADALGIDYEKAPGTEGGPPLEDEAPAKAQPSASTEAGKAASTQAPSPAKSTGLPVENPIKQGQ